jgi:glycosyltransferase involved in cell wall biosynthesis
MPIRVLELRSVLGAGGGPEKTILVGSAQSNPTQFPVTVCYLRDARDREFDLGRRAAALDLDFVEIVERHSFDPRIWAQLVDVVRARKIDIVHSHDYKTDFLALLLAWRERVVSIATAHGWIRNTARERFYARADLRVLARLSAVIAVSGPIKAEILASGVRVDRVHQVPNGVDHRLYRPDAETRRLVRARLGPQRRRWLAPSAD